MKGSRFSGWRRSAVAFVTVLVFLDYLAGSGWCDPLIELPPAGKGTLTQNEDGTAELALVGEVDLLAVLGSEPATSYPEVGVIKGNEPELGVARVGLLSVGPSLSYLARADFSEALRVDLDLLKDRPIATIDAFLDDAVLWWTPEIWASVAIGRYKVPFSFFRQIERGKLTASSVPFFVDRVAPDRRWGVTFHGDIGSMNYAAGVYADFDELELRAGEKDDLSEPDMDPEDPLRDPSSRGRSLAVLYVGGIPRAPKGSDHMATPPSDPWFGIIRPAAGIGFMWRNRAGTDRFDFSMNGQLKYRRIAAAGEILAYAEGDDLGIGIGGQISFLVSERAVVFARGEVDGERELSAAGGGLSVYATKDRRNKISLVGWVRRDFNDGPKRDGAVVHIQASL